MPLRGTSLNIKTLWSARGRKLSHRSGRWKNIILTQYPTLKSQLPWRILGTKKTQQKTLTMKRRTFRDYSYINKFLLNASGVLPMKSANDVTSVYLVFLALGSLAFLLGPSLYSLIFNWDNIETSERFDMAVTGHFFILCIIKGTHSYYTSN